MSVPLRTAALLLLLASCGHTVVPAPQAIVGHVTHETARLRIEGDGVDDAAIEVRGPGTPRARIEDDAPADPRRALAVIEGLAPRERYQVRLDGRRAAAFRTMPAPGAQERVRFAVGSCMDASMPMVSARLNDARRPVGNHAVWGPLGAEDLDGFLLIGDRFYLPSRTEDLEALGEAELDATFARHHASSLAILGVRERFSTCPTYVVYDDHDYAGNDAGGSFRYKDLALRWLRLGFANPPMGEPDNPGCYFRVRTGAMELFLLDGRYHRSCAAGKSGSECRPPSRRRPDGTYAGDPPAPHLYGERQMAWLREGLTTSDAEVKVIVAPGQMMPNVNDMEGWFLYEEREAFLAWLSKSRVPGVVFVTGDRHHGEIGSLREGGPYPLYELTASGLGVDLTRAGEPVLGAAWQTIGASATVPHYGVCEYDPAGGGRVVMRLVADDGAEINAVAIPLERLRAPPR